MKTAIRDAISRPWTQTTLLRLLKLCHAGLNYGGGQTVEDSGEIGALEFVRDTLRLSRPMVIFDVGANNGEYLLAALKVVGEGVKVYSFEPQSMCFERLQARFANEPRVDLKKAALGKVAGTAELFFGTEGDTTASLTGSSDLTGVQTETVTVRTVDEVCATEGIDRIDFLKIDVEGFEMDVLLGASDLLSKGSLSAIQFEFGDTFLHTSYHFVDLWELLSPRYRIYRILRKGLIEVERYVPDLEIYKIANFLCVDKKLMPS